MVKRDVVIRNKQGLHARPCGIISQVAMKFRSRIVLIKDGYEVNPRSIMGLLAMALSEGSVVTIVADGVDEKEAVEEIAKLLESEFEEGL